MTNYNQYGIISSAEKDTCTLSDDSFKEQHQGVSSLEWIPGNISQTA